jgi:CheY-like chemotaxis protein
MRIQTVPSDSVDVLIVEDDALIRTGLRLLLEKCGYRCVEAADGREALALARAEPPRCVLLDLVMPGMDGFAVARRLRADLRTFGSHIHCVTGLRDPQVREHAQRFGCEEFLTKPVNEADLLKIVDRDIGREIKVQTAVVSGLTKKQAEDLLDWLGNHGCTGLAVTTEDDGFAVRCNCPPGFRLAQEEGEGLRLVRSEP